ncbi:MAG: ribonuclease P protein component [Bacteroidales bacterium]|nr:ribonuclease P protein component [Bacteroidales bacterium]
MTTSKFPFPKQYRRISKIKAQSLFVNSNHFFENPFLVRFLIEPAPMGSYRLLISLSKKRIPLATTRNLIKRRIREAWRKNIPTVLKNLQTRNFLLYVNIHYTLSYAVSYHVIEGAIIKSLERLVSLYEEIAK